VLKVNYVGNYIRPGPSSKARFPIHVGAPSDMRFYIKDNVFEGNDRLTANNALFFDAVELKGKRQVQTVAAPFPVLPVRTQSAREAYEAVLAVAGASLPARDAVDRRIVAQVRNGAGKIIDSQNEVGGWPELKSAAPPLDSDHDGMPDAWESRHGLNPKNPSDAARSRDKNGYTNLEHYLNRTDPNGKIDFRDPKNNIHTLHQPLLSRPAGPDKGARKPGKAVKPRDLPRPDITVAADGSGDFQSIQAAVATVPHANRERTVIYVKDGVYKEKVRVDPSYITLRGQSRKGTRLEFAQLQDDFLKNPDKIGRAVINVNGNDFVVENMTVANTAGVVGRHAFTIYGRGDRTVLLDSDILSDGADTVALWLGQRGRYYHARCAFRGAVDYLCPRGWCYISDSTFFETRRSAAVWHDGSRNKDMKFVLRNCAFDGVKGWYLARHHHDAQFYFLDCTFAATMIDRAPFRVVYPLKGGNPNERDKKKNADLDKTNRWGERAYFWNCHRAGGDYAWHQDNLKQAPGAPAAGHITAAWTFGGQWDPENPTGPVIRGVSVQGSKVALTFSESVTVKGKPRLVLADGGLADYKSGSGSAVLAFTIPTAGQGVGVKSVDLNGGAINATEAAATLRLADMSGCVLRASD
jgi:pectinesterase